MKIYHLADLHLGKQIYGLSMLEDQKYWIDQFISYCDSKRPDVILLAGDIYDRAAPSSAAVELLDHLLSELFKRKIETMIIAGNHDSGQRLNYGKTLFAKNSIHIAGSVSSPIEHIRLEDEYGPVCFWLLPYIFPDQIRLLLDDEDITNYDQAMRKLLEKQDIDTSIRNVLIAHQNVIADGKEVEFGGSETIVGGVGQIDYSVFNKFDYVALGHIHSNYHVGRNEVRYAGTPLCYHLDETRSKNKGFTRIILKEKGNNITIDNISLEPLHKMRSLCGSKQEIYDLLKDDAGRDEYIGIRINDQRITPEIAGYLRNLITSRGSVLLELISTYTSRTVGSVTSENKSDRLKPIEDLFADFYTAQYGNTPPEDDEYELMSFIGELVRNSDSHDQLDPKLIEKTLQKAERIKGSKQ